MFINFSNHISKNWRPEQWDYTSERYGEIVDISFPMVGVDMDEKEVDILAEKCVQKIEKAIGDAEGIVMCQGEFTLTYAVVCKLLSRNITCVAALTERKSKEIYEANKTMKISEFVFRGYREYR